MSDEGNPLFKEEIRLLFGDAHRFAVVILAPRFRPEVILALTAGFKAAVSPELMLVVSPEARLAEISGLSPDVIPVLREAIPELGVESLMFRLDPEFSVLVTTPWIEVEIPAPSGEDIPPLNVEEMPMVEVTPPPKVELSPLPRVVLETPLFGKGVLGEVCSSTSDLIETTSLLLLMNTETTLVSYNILIFSWAVRVYCYG